MKSWARHRTWVALWITGHAFLAASPTAAGGLLDCLFGSSSSDVGEVTAYAPPTGTRSAAPSTSPHSAFRPASPAVTAGYPSSCQTAGTAQTVQSPASAPTVVYQPTATACCPAPAATAPRAYYRTTWKRIPVTRYQPTTSADPITGSPVTVMKPCTTHVWRPVRRRCGLLARLLGLCDPAPAVPVTAACPAYVMSPSMAAPGCGTATSPPVSPPSSAAAPYYVPSSPPNTTGPTPSPATPPPTLDRQSRPGRPAETPEPADTRPSLVPGTPGSGTPSQPPGATGSATRSSARHSGATTLRSQGAPSQENRRSSAPAGNTVPLPEPSESSAPPEPRTPAPVPGPDATPAQGDADAAPELLNPQDRVASRYPRSEWAHTAISWPQRQTTTRHHEEDAARTQRKSLDDSGWDDSGWRSIAD